MVIKTFESVSYEKRDRIAWITINAAKKMNALSVGVRNGLWDSFDEADNDSDVLVVVLTGSGGRAFCAGADLKEIAERDPTLGDRTTKDVRSVFTKVSETLKPIIAAIDGYALGGGMQLSARCVFRIATEGSIFGMPEALRSLTPVNMMDTLEMGFVPLGWALWLMLSGEHITAANARDIGFVQWLVPDRETLMAEAE